MEWAEGLAGKLEVVVQVFGALNGTGEERFGETAGELLCNSGSLDVSLMLEWYMECFDPEVYLAECANNRLGGQLLLRNGL